MHSQDTPALMRPQHPLDMPALTVHALAGIGRASLALAHRLNAVVARRAHASAPRGRPPQPGAIRSCSEHGVPQSVHVR